MIGWARDPGEAAFTKKQPYELILETSANFPLAKQGKSISQSKCGHVGHECGVAAAEDEWGHVVTEEPKRQIGARLQQAPNAI